MKVGIMTFPHSVSYGCTLQMYALQQTVKTLGHEVEVIHYQNEYMREEKHVVKKAGAPSMKEKLRKMARRLLHCRMYKAFTAFEMKNTELYPLKPFADRHMLELVGQRYNAIVCGSDQVWNPEITGCDLAYFLDFCNEKIRRVAYAPSFGIDVFSNEFRDRIRGELKRFYALSAREASGQMLVRELTGCDVSVVMDPTFFLEEGEWKKLEREHPAAQEEYILYFTVRSSKSLWEKTLEFSKQTGLKVVVVGGSVLKKKADGIEYAVDICPGQWIYLLRRARYVVTNSFHGTAFSINFRKDFYLELSARTNSRLVQIVRAMGLENRIVEGALEPSAANFSVVENKLPELCRVSLEYLKQALQ